MRPRHACRRHSAVDPAASARTLHSSLSSYDAGLVSPSHNQQLTSLSKRRTLHLLRERIHDVRDACTPWLRRRSSERIPRRGPKDYGIDVRICLGTCILYWIECFCVDQSSLMCPIRTSDVSAKRKPQMQLTNMQPFRITPVLPRVWCVARRTCVWYADLRQSSCRRIPVRLRRSDLWGASHTTFFPLRTHSPYHQRSSSFERRRD